MKYQMHLQRRRETKGKKKKHANIVCGVSSKRKEKKLQNNGTMFFG